MYFNFSKIKINFFIFYLIYNNNILMKYSNKKKITKEVEGKLRKCKNFFFLKNKPNYQNSLLINK